MIGGFFEPPKKDTNTSELDPVVVVVILGTDTSNGESKLIVPIKGKPAIRRVAEAAIASKAKHVMVVAGNETETVEKALEGLELRITPNKEYQKGETTYVTAGLNAASEVAEAVLFLPGNLAAIGPSLIDEILDGWMISQKSIVIPSYENTTGHPILIGRYYFLDVLAISEEGKPLKDLVELHQDETHYVAVKSPAILLDVNKPEDTEQLYKLLPE
ncbi:MAG: NTP transferase domain-containing protein [Candidatus Bathyarchaeia archaeon]